MLSALLSFLGGSVFRMIWGEVASFLNKRQDHTFELERLRLQSELDDRAHARHSEALRLQAELGVKTIEAQREAYVDQAGADAFTEAMRSAFKRTGYAFVDIWNGCIRPCAASIVLCLWVGKLIAQGGKMDEWDQELAGAVLGFFFADRALGKRGK